MDTNVLVRRRNPVLVIIPRKNFLIAVIFRLNLKILLLVRDPRGTMQSRKHRVSDLVFNCGGCNEIWKVNKESTGNSIAESFFKGTTRMIFQFTFVNLIQISFL
jgi:hypothetical protein